MESNNLYGDLLKEHPLERDFDPTINNPLPLFPSGQPSMVPVNLNITGNPQTGPLPGAKMNSADLPLQGQISMENGRFLAPKAAF